MRIVVNDDEGQDRAVVGTGCLGVLLALLGAGSSVAIISRRWASCTGGVHATGDALTLQFLLFGSPFLLLAVGATFAIWMYRSTRYQPPMKRFGLMTLAMLTGIVAVSALLVLANGSNPHPGVPCQTS
ncbi:hypothetical protein [Streptomyces sp. LS1784]|uniref:hypothetical protein n=1 Tax=Streptomyces sp. LS1784 TaxID=2851533 RepID=UPI001CCF807A|nr:hypothetical protein [Streptomyces sp. LS1784]